MNKTIGLLAIGLFFLSLSSIWAPVFSGSGTHSGQGWRTDPNGPIILSDFRGVKVQLVANNKEWAKTVPDLMPLLMEIYNASPQVGFLLLRQLMSVTFMITADPLVLAPRENNNLIQTDHEKLPNVQAGYRIGKDILFTEAALMDDINGRAQGGNHYFPPSYNVVHELLHGLVSGSGPFHEWKVGGMNDFFRKNRGHYTEESILGAANAAEIDSQDQYFKRPFYREALDLLVKEVGDFEARCLIFSRAWEYDLFTPGEISFLKKWAYASCSNSQRTSEEYFFEKNLHLKNLFSSYIKERVTFIYKINLPFKISRGWKDLYLNQCQNYASDKLRAAIEHSTQMATDLLAAIRKLQDSTPDDRAVALLGQLAFKFGYGHFSEREFENDLREQKQRLSIWEQNRSECQRAFPKYFLSK